MVNVLLRKRDYVGALTLAEDNYIRHRNNIHHINAYFTCLIKKENLEEDEIITLNELLEKTRRSLDKRASEFYGTMKSEYDYYIKGEANEAIRELREALRVDKHNYHAFKALVEILLNEGMTAPSKNLKLISRIFRKGMTN